MSCHYDPVCPYSRVLHRGIPGVVDGVLSLTTAMLAGGASMIRRVIEETVWQDSAAGCGHRFGHRTVHHHYRHTCVPPSHGTRCC